MGKAPVSCLSTWIVESPHIQKIDRIDREIKEMIRYPYQVSLNEKECFYFPSL
jgi:hypothetical protein